jgi:phosphatidylethanolamine/phosphatidyl-N-methylethanolamine N-methyltransferase
MGSDKTLTDRQPQLITRLNATGLFLQELVTRPRLVGAILPSSRQLAVSMARWLTPYSNSYVLELGPGTGSVTKALLEHGLREDRLIAIEQSPKMAGLLRSHFPKAKIITGDAFELDKLLLQFPRAAGNISTVFSSLPLMNFEPAAAEKLALMIRALLPPGGKLIQYSYHVANRQPKAASHFEFVASELIWLNIPPARVSVYRK